MGQLDDRRKWQEQLPIEHHHLLDGLERHLRPQSWDLEFVAWFNDGRSGSPVARVMHTGENAQLILKFCESSQRCEQLGRAMRPKNAFVRQHLAQLVDNQAFPLGDGDACATFMTVGGGDLKHYQSLATVRGAPSTKVNIDYGAIVRSVIAEWNDDGPTRASGTVRSFVGRIVGRRRGSVIRWIRKADDLGSRAPLDLLTAVQGRWMVKDLLFGKTHGDLSSRNILVSPEPAKFELIDYDHYEADGPLARDPMHLLVGLAIDDFERLRAAGPQVINAIVDPRQADVPPHVEYFRAISQEIHKACRISFPKKRGLGDLWTAQCLLALVGVALLRVGRTITTADPEAARRWCYELAVAAAERYQEQFDGTALPADPPATGSGDMIDRYFEREHLAARLSHGPHGIVTVQGRTGVGKSKLVDAVIDTLGEGVRYERRQATPDYPLDIPTLIELISGKPSGVASGQGAALVRLEAVLAKAEKPVVIAIESAEQLLDSALMDLGLDEAFALIDNDERHQVSVVLESPDCEAPSPPWPNEDEITLPELGRVHFRDLLCEMDRGNRLGLDELTDERFTQLWQCAGGLPRIGELVFAAVCHAIVSLPQLVEGLGRHRHEPTAYLIRTLTEDMHLVHRDVLRALAALGTPVPIEAVQRTLRDVEPGRTRQSLRHLHGDHLVRCESGLYFLPGADAKAVLEAMPPDEKCNLSVSAAQALKDCTVRRPRNLADLRYDLARVRALFAAGRHPGAVGLINDVDQYLRAWNCTAVLLRYRLELREHLRNPELVKVNENALGGIHLATGSLDDARDAFDNALRIAGQDPKPGELARLHGNVADVDWESGSIEKARSGHETALSFAREAGDQIAVMKSMTGLADCHRSRGEYSKAIGLAAEAFEFSRSSAFAGLREADIDGRTLAVGLTARLSRWCAELDDLGEARRWLRQADIAKGSGPSHLATYLDALADLKLHEGLRTGAVSEAIEVAGRAVNVAFEVQDRAALVQARTTLCVAYLRMGSPAEAARAITRAAWHRRGRDLIVLGLMALTNRLVGNRRDATSHFTELLKEADRRIDKDAGPRVVAGKVLATGRTDFEARHLQGFAKCGLILAGRSDVAEAISSFRMPEIASPPQVPGLVRRMAFMLECLDTEAPGTLTPVIAALGLNDV